MFSCRLLQGGHIPPHRITLCREQGSKLKNHVIRIIPAQTDRLAKVGTRTPDLHAEAHQPIRQRNDESEHRASRLAYDDQGLRLATARNGRAQAELDRTILLRLIRGSWETAPHHTQDLSGKRLARGGSIHHIDPGVNLSRQPGWLGHDTTDQLTPIQRDGQLDDPPRRLLRIAGRQHPAAETPDLVHLRGIDIQRLAEHRRPANHLTAQPHASVRQVLHEKQFSLVASPHREEGLAETRAPVLEAYPQSGEAVCLPLHRRSRLHAHFHHPQTMIHGPPALALGRTKQLVQVGGERKRMPHGHQRLKRWLPQNFNFVKVARGVHKPVIGSGLRLLPLRYSHQRLPPPVKLPRKPDDIRLPHEPGGIHHQKTGEQTRPEHRLGRQPGGGPKPQRQTQERGHLPDQPPVHREFMHHIAGHDEQHPDGRHRDHGPQAWRNGPPPCRRAPTPTPNHPGAQRQGHQRPRALCPQQKRPRLKAGPIVALVDGSGKSPGPLEHLSAAPRSIDAPRRHHHAPRAECGRCPARHAPQPRNPPVERAPNQDHPHQRPVAVVDREGHAGQDARPPCPPQRRTARGHIQRGQRQAHRGVVGQKMPGVVEKRGAGRRREQAPHLRPVRTAEPAGQQADPKHRRRGKQTPENPGKPGRPAESPFRQRGHHAQKLESDVIPALKGKRQSLPPLALDDEPGGIPRHRIPCLIREKKLPAQKT